VPASRLGGRSLLLDDEEKGSDTSEAYETAVFTEVDRAMTEARGLPADTPSHS